MARVSNPGGVPTIGPAAVDTSRWRSSTFAGVASRIQEWRRGLFGGEPLIRPSEVGTDRVLFGSDWPHPEGLKDPITFVDELTDFGEEDVAKIMGGNLMKLMKVSKPVNA